MTTGEKIAALRREKGLSQEGLGEQLGLSRQAVSKWEADQAVPTMDNLVELSRLFGVPVDTLLRPEEELPGREQEPSEGVKISAEGLKVSYAPVLTKKTKWFIIALAALVLVSVLGNFYAMVRVQGMRARMENLTASWEKGLTGVAQGTITPEEYMVKLQDFVARRTNIVKQLNNQSVLFSQFDAAAGFYRKPGAQPAPPANKEE